MICFIYDLHHEHHGRNRLLEKPAELRRQHPDLPDAKVPLGGRPRTARLTKPVDLVHGTEDLLGFFHDPGSHG
jgi:hypothetical protein